MFAMNSDTGKARKSFCVVLCTVVKSSRADEASIVLSSSGLSKTTIGMQSEQRIGAV